MFSDDQILHEDVSVVAERQLTGVDLHRTSTSSTYHSTNAGSTICEVPQHNPLKTVPAAHFDFKKEEESLETLDVTSGKNTGVSDNAESKTEHPTSCSVVPRDKEDNFQRVLIKLQQDWLNFRTWFTPYRQLFLLVTALNVGLIIGIEAGALGGWEEQDFSLFVILHILVAIGIRNEWFLRFLYWLAIKCFRSPRFPVAFRKQVVGILYHIGMCISVGFFWGGGEDSDWYGLYPSDV